MNASDLNDWKRHPVTQAVFSTLHYRINEMTEALIENAGKDPLQDRYYSGAILAHRDTLSVAFDEINQEDFK